MLSTVSGRNYRSNAAAVLTVFSPPGPLGVAEVLLRITRCTVYFTMSKSGFTWRKYLEYNTYLIEILTHLVH